MAMSEVRMCLFCTLGERYGNCDRWIYFLVDSKLMYKPHSEYGQSVRVSRVIFPSVCAPEEQLH